MGREEVYYGGRSVADRVRGEVCLAERSISPCWLQVLLHTTASGRTSPKCVKSSGGGMARSPSGFDRCDYG